ncbi:MAG: biopolymer transporter ExbD [Puniceicoccales bacterium]|jgi:biopolymer transport protein ExbD|nr:biopolymer transporter ExbD [Puniceicoccales bacterium]
MRQQENKSPGDLGFQIAPMIDVVFVIMLFFMVMAGAVKVEFELKIKLPGDSEAAASQEIPDELTIAITEKGQVSINDSNVDTPQSKELRQLYIEICKLRENARRAKTKLLVTVQADETTVYERIALVLDTLAQAEANENVTFSIGEAEEV